MRLKLFAVATLLLVVAACATVPLTGRTQLNLVSDQQLIGSANQQFAQFMRLANDRNVVLAASESPQAAAVVELVNRVSVRIVDAAGLRGERHWETVVVKSNQANAFVMPNGKIVVFTGILSVAKTEAALGAVIGHVVGRHAAERMSQALLVQLGAASVDAALAAGNNAKYRPVVGAALGLGAQYGILLPFSRAHESEADHLGLYYMAKAGYDPEEAIGLWERMEAQGGKGPWEFLSTHPSPETRRAQIQEWLPDARVYYVDRSRPLPTNLAHVEKVRSDLSQRAALAPVAARPSLPRRVHVPAPGQQPADAYHVPHRPDRILPSGPVLHREGRQRRCHDIHHGFSRR